MATELFSLWGGLTGWRSQRGAGYDVSATLDGIDFYYYADDHRTVTRARLSARADVLCCDACCHF